MASSKEERQNKYWRDRESEALKHYLTDEVEYQRRIDEIYADMLESCQSEIDRFYRKYASDEGVSLAEAKKRVSKLDIKAYERKAAKYVADAEHDRRIGGGKTNLRGYYFSSTANAEMKLYNATMKINRLEMLKANIGLELVKGTAELETFMEEILQGRTEEELERQAGILGDTIKNNAQAAHAIVNASFHNATFSERLWNHQTQMKADLSVLLQRGLIQGKGNRELARELQRYFIGDERMKNGKKGAKYRAETLMRTELARVQTAAQEASFKKMGFDDYTFHANSGCCGDCQALNGKHFPLSKMAIGENAPPIHPRCRCSMSAYSDRKEYDEWLDFLANGGTTEEYNKMKAGKSLSYEDMKKKIADDRKRTSDIRSESLEIDRKISEYQRKERQFSDFDGLKKQEIRGKINALDDRISELEKINDRWYNRPERGTPEYTEWREWRKTVDPSFADDLIRLTVERSDLNSKLLQWDNYEEWLKWKKENPLDKLQASKTALADELNTLKIRIAENESQIAVKRLIEDIDSQSIERRTINKHNKALSDDEIISALSGGDKTKGSCASLGLAYIGQKQGWNVLDFRDGVSRQFFSYGDNLNGIAKAKGVKTLRANGASSLTVGNRLLKQCEAGKEYYLCVGRHVSIVRKTEDGVLQYLELQSATRSGWTNFGDKPRDTLAWRFGCSSKSDSSSIWDFMIDIAESDFDNDDFKSLLEYINTAEDKQMKGVSGSVK